LLLAQESATLLEMPKSIFECLLGAAVH